MARRTATVEAPTTNENAEMETENVSDTEVTKPHKTRKPPVDLSHVVVRETTRTLVEKSPVVLAIENAVKGTWYDMHVENTPEAIDALQKSARAAANQRGVGLNFHRDKPASDEIENGVIISFKTRDKVIRKSSTAPVGDSAGATAETSVVDDNAATDGSYSMDSNTEYNYAQ